MRIHSLERDRRQNSPSSQVLDVFLVRWCVQPNWSRTYMMAVCSRSSTMFSSPPMDMMAAANIHLQVSKCQHGPAVFKSTRRGGHESPPHWIRALGKGDGRTNRDLWVPPPKNTDFY